MAKSTPAAFSTLAIERAMAWLRCSNAAVQPTQNSTAASGLSARRGTSSPSAQSVRENCVPRQGWPRCSRLSRAFIAVSGALDSSSTI